MQCPRMHGPAPRGATNAQPVAQPPTAQTASYPAGASRTRSPHAATTPTTCHRQGRAGRGPSKLPGPRSRPHAHPPQRAAGPHRTFCGPPVLQAGGSGTGQDARHASSGARHPQPRRSHQRATALRVTTHRALARAVGDPDERSQSARRCDDGRHMIRWAAMVGECR